MSGVFVQLQAGRRGRGKVSLVTAQPSLHDLQVRFVYEAFCKMQPGTIIMSLHGKQNQSKRNVMFEKFCNVKHAVMLCTDIAARGLDFPAVDWVLQADAPEDADTYIHRVGRTARFQANGKALLFLVP